MKKPTNKNIMPKDLQNFLNRYGFVLEHVNGDHFIYSYPHQIKNFMINIPMAKPVKPSYIDQVRKIIMEIEENEEV